MTREEIIQGLQFTIDMFLLDPTTGETYTEPRNDMDKATIDACRGAIELLEQEPCEDAISRQAAIEYLMTNMNWYDEDGYESDDDYKRECITDLINGVPSVTPRAEMENDE